MYVVRLLSHCARYAPDGRIAADLIEHAAGWTKRNTALVEALTDAGFIERDGDGFIVHGWEERNGAHARKAEKDAKKPRGNLHRPAGDQRGTGAGPAGEKEKEREKEREKDLPRPPAAVLNAGQAGGRKGLGPLGSEVVSRVEAGLAKPLDPTTRTKAQDFESLIEAHGGVEAAVDFIAHKCRTRTAEPRGVGLLVDWLADDVQAAGSVA
jgi:hypothetical protein